MQESNVKSVSTYCPVLVIRYNKTGGISRKRNNKGQEQWLNVPFFHFRKPISVLKKKPKNKTTKKQPLGWALPF